MNELPEKSVHMAVTSPPYWGLRLYLDKDDPNRHLEIGQEETAEAYIESMRQIFGGENNPVGVWRVLRDDSVLWVNWGDSYSSTGGRTSAHGPNADCGNTLSEATPTSRSGPRNMKELKPKNLVGIPWRCALALQADGWILRSDIIWHKTSPMPESVTDRCTKAHEYIFMFAKNEKYFFDNEAIKEPCESDHPSGAGYKREHRLTYQNADGTARGNDAEWNNIGGTRNKRDVWTVGPSGFSGAHFACYPPDLIKPCILSSTSAKGCCPKCGSPWERIVETESVGRRRKDGMPIAPMPGHPEPDTGAAGSTITKTVGWEPTCKCGETSLVPCTVIDPFGGSGTTGQVAIELGRNAILVELNPKYIPLIETRTSTTPGLALA